MVKFIKKIKRTPGLMPGTLEYIGEKKTEAPKITIFDYNETTFQEKEIKSFEETFSFKDTPTISWINIDGVHDIWLVERVGTYFGLHPLILEDIVDTTQRPKIEYFEDYIFIVLKMVYFDKEKDAIAVEQVSLAIGRNFVLSFQERSEGDIFNGVRERIRLSKGWVRKEGADYLGYSLLDAVVDNYFSMLEEFGEDIEAVEEILMAGPDRDVLNSIYMLKKDLISLRKSIWPLREVINGLKREETPLIRQFTLIYLRDLYDHTIQVIDTLEAQRDLASGMLEIYLSSVSNKMNQIMKVLTIIATVFIPLTFITGVYGMNFKHMPELEWRWGYYVVVGVIVFAGSSMLMFFKRRKWF